MAREIAGKIFRTAEEAGVAPLSDEEREAERRAFDEARAKWSDVPRSNPRSVPDRFHDDLVGTEYEGWTPDPGSDS